MHSTVITFCWTRPNPPVVLIGLVFEVVSSVLMRDTSDTTAELDLATIKRCSGDFVWDVSGVVWAPGPAVGFKGYGVPARIVA